MTPSTSGLQNQTPYFDSFRATGKLASRIFQKFCQSKLANHPGRGIHRLAIALSQGYSLNRREQLVSVSHPQNPQALQALALDQAGIQYAGAKNWKKHFGEVGFEPALPSNILNTLNAPCPYWKGKKIKETHLLTLIPATINGNPFTLNTLEELIRKPHGGINATKFRHYCEYVREEIGNNITTHSYWILLTKDVLPYSQGHSFDWQTTLIRKSYEVPKAIEIATAALMHQVETGERLLSDHRDTYTRASEKVISNRWHVGLGSFESSGLSITHISTTSGYDNHGLIVARRL